MRSFAITMCLAICSPVALHAEPGEGAKPPAAANGGEEAKKPKPDFPPFDKVIDGLKKVVSTTDGAAPLFDLYKDPKSSKLLGVLPAKYADGLYMIASTISGGDPNSGVMGPTNYIKWRKINKKIALIAPDLSVRTEGDQQAKDSVKSLYSGRVVASAPILSMAPGSRPVIDLGALGTVQVAKFFGSKEKVSSDLATLIKAKAFPKNVIFEYEFPESNGNLIRVTQAISKLEGTKGYKPRKADPRVGYFYDYHRDYARTSTEDVTSRYISRWHVEKADAELNVSPPKQPITWYIEHTTPIRFRRYVREGISLWNSAFRNIGIDQAIVVYQQDASTGAHMDKDPEDARYNFFRWNASDQRYAIGPSRTNPLTGEILDADVVWHQGLTRSIRGMFERATEDIASETFGPETLEWFADHPNWDPRIRLISPEQRIARNADGVARQDTAVTSLAASNDQWLRAGSHSAVNGACRIGNRVALELGLASAAFAAGMLDAGEGDTLDGLPENYIGPMIRYISAHEVGHCLGLQHNMAASSWKTLKEINTEGYTGPTVASVMDYAAPNINHEIGEVQGPYVTDRVGVYDDWAIAYGYGPEDKMKDVLAEVNEPGHLFVSQMAIFFGGDPRNNTWDLGADSLNFARERLGIAKKLRASLVEKQVKEGEPWSKARRRFNMINGSHVSSLFLASVWIGSTYINNNFKGDKDELTPIAEVSGAKQREALELILENSFEDDAFGITPELLRHLSRDYWWDPEGMRGFTADPNFPVHDFVGGVQATALSLLMNPTKLRRVYDNEFRADDDDDALTLAELLTTVTDAAWRECAKSGKSKYSTRSPMISGFRRNLQQEHMQRLVDLALLHDAPNSSLRTVGTLAAQELRRINDMVASAAKRNLDPYTEAHLADVQVRIAKAQEATYTIRQ